MKTSCPSCGSASLVEGRLLLSGTDDGWVARFFPKGLPFFTLRKSVTLANGELFRACTQCGHTWSQVSPTELRELLTGSGDPKTIQELKRS
jgi:hypothetical protein